MHGDNYTIQADQNAGEVSRCSRYSLLGWIVVPCVATLYFFSHPILARLARETCYHRWGNPGFYNAPFSSVGALFSCEYASNASFNWQHTLEWVRDYVVGAAATITGIVGPITLAGRYLWNNNCRRKNQGILPTTNDEQQLIPNHYYHPYGYQPTTRHYMFNPQDSSSLSYYMNVVQPIKQLSYKLSHSSHNQSDQELANNVLKTSPCILNMLPMANSGMIKPLSEIRGKSLTPTYVNRLSVEEQFENQGLYDSNSDSRRFD